MKKFILFTMFMVIFYGCDDDLQFQPYFAGNGVYCNVPFFDGYDDFLPPEADQYEDYTPPVDIGDEEEDSGGDGDGDGDAEVYLCPNGKYLVCHTPAADVSSSICVGAHAAYLAHLAHGDTPGECY